MTYSNILTSFLCSAYLGITSMGLAIAEEATLYQKAPSDWRAEVVELPLSFAPDLDIKGTKELRFSPGMFVSDSDTYFTYSFVWWLEGEPVFDTERIEQALVQYYQGLYRLVSEKQMDVSGFSATFHASKEAGLNSFSGSAELIDPFVTEQRLVLRIKVEQSFCAAQERTALFFRLSPQPFDGPNWNVLAAQSAGQCR